MKIEGLSGKLVGQRCCFALFEHLHPISFLKGCKENRLGLSRQLYLGAEELFTLNFQSAHPVSVISEERSARIQSSGEGENLSRCPFCQLEGLLLR